MRVNIAGQYLHHVFRKAFFEITSGMPAYLRYTVIGIQ